MQYLNLVLNNAFTLSIFLIVIGSLVGIYARSRSRDRCLKHFEGFMVSLERTDGRQVWGRLRVYGSGIELIYADGHQDEQGHVENSYVLYNGEFGEITALYRYHDELDDRERGLREKDIRRVHKPTAVSILQRKIKNFLNTFKDAILQAFNLFVGSKSRGKAGGALVVKQPEISKIGGQLINISAGNAFDPILERYMGQFVVAEQDREDKIEEIPGILREYSSKFLELLNVKVTLNLSMPAGRGGCLRHPLVDADEGDGEITVTNKSGFRLSEVIIRTAAGETKLDADIRADATASVDLPPAEAGEEAEIVIGVPRTADMILPRETSVMRHGQERVKHTLETLLGLDTWFARPKIAAIRRVLAMKEKDQPRNG